MKTYGMVAALFCLTSAAGAEVKSKVVDYKQGDIPLQGLLAWDDAAKGKKPGILVVHEWWGNNEHARNQALRLAKAGYVAFALDMYGKGKVTTHPKDAQAFAAEATKDPKTVDARFNAALEILKASPQVDASKIGAIGYCFGGGVVLTEVRKGADLQAVATFHGALKTDHPAKPGTVKPRILILTGEADPMVTAPGAKHGFTNPDAGKAGMDALAYNADADKKSWAAMLATFKQVFTP